MYLDWSCLNRGVLKPHSSMRGFAVASALRPSHCVSQSKVVRIVLHAKHVEPRFKPHVRSRRCIVDQVRGRLIRDRAIVN